MLEERNLKLDLFALALLVLVIFLALALLTYNPADPVGELVWPLSRLHAPDALVYPPNESVTNACGRWGSQAADVSLTGLGLGAYYLVLSLGVLDVLLLMRRQINAPLLRLFGWIASLVGLTSLAALIMSALSPGPVIGSGGYLGAAGRAVLQAHFASVGSVILALSLIVGGLLLCTDYALISITIRACSFLAAGISGFRQRITRKTGLKQDEEHEWEEEEDQQQLTVRVSGRRISEIEDEELEEDEEDLEEVEDEEEVDEDEQQEQEFDQEQQEQPVEERKSLLASVKNRLTPRLRVRKPPEPSQHEEVIHQLEAASQAEEPVHYELPSLDLLLSEDDISYEEQEKEVRNKAKLLEKTFLSFGFKVKVVEIETGPVIAQYEVQLESGLRLSRITGLADDLAIAMRVPSVRIVAPIPGKNTVGIEVPNSQRQIVRLREVIEEAGARAKRMRIPLFLGKDVSGKPLVVDLATLPHLLIAGRTGTGKSVCLNAIISSILMSRRPDEVRMLMIDPKMVELSGYQTLPHLMHPVVTDMRKAEAILAWAVEKMEERYSLLAKAGVRHISVYNQLGEEELMERLQVESDEDRQEVPLHLPYIVIIADELADLMMTSGKEVEQSIIRLAQKSRAVGIHLILATQKPTVDVITGLIKSNLPARISFQVASRTDSRVVLDEMGADKLLGNGDMLFLWPGTSTLLRGQGTYLSDDEISGLVDAVSTGKQDFVKELVHLKLPDSGEEKLGKLNNRDEMYESAVDIVVREARGSVSLLQRSLGIGYGRAARLIDFMAEDGIVGPYAGSQAREVIISMEDWQRMQGHESESETESETDAPTRRRSNKIIPVSDWEDDDDGQSPAAGGEAEEQLEEEHVEEDQEEYEVAEEEEDEYEEDELDEGDVEEYEEEEEYEEDEEDEYEEPDEKDVDENACEEEDYAKPGDLYEAESA